MKKVLTVLLIVFSILIIGVLNNAYAGSRKYYKEQMKDVETIALLPMSYELIVPDFEDPKKQREGFSEEETREKRDGYISQVPEKLKEYIEERGYELVYVNPPDKQGDITAIIEKIKSMRKELIKASNSEEKALLDDEIGSYVRDLGLHKDSNVILILLCRDRLGTGAEATKRSFGLLGQLAARDSWKDEYIGYPTVPDYTYIHIFVIDSNTLELLDLSIVLETDSMYNNEHILKGLLRRASRQLPKK